MGRFRGVNNDENEIYFSTLYFSHYLVNSLLIKPVLHTIIAPHHGVRRMRKPGKSLKNIIFYRVSLSGQASITSESQLHMVGHQEVTVLGLLIWQVFRRMCITCTRANGQRRMCFTSFLTGTGPKGRWLTFGPTAM